MINATINGTAIQAFDGATILQAATKAGFDIPTLCFMRKFNSIGSCRVCVVEVEGFEAPVPACNTALEEGMQITTDSDTVLSYRRMALELLLAEHGPVTPERCSTCAVDGDCRLQSVCMQLGVTGVIDGNNDAPCADLPQKPVVEDNPFLRYDANLCISCQRCVAACNKAACNHSIQTGRKGAATIIRTPFGSDWKTNSCESCGNCAQACPTGALTEKRRQDYRASEVTKVRTTCPHCGVGCQLELVVKDGKVVDAQGANGPSNEGLLCVKGRSGSFDFITSPERLTSPLIKDRSTGQFHEASWDEALDVVAQNFGAIKKEHGGSALAAFACSRSTNEDIYLLQKMGRAVLDTNNIDNCARV